MITTALAAMAVSGLLAPCAANTLPTWQSDYAQAMATAVTQQKPMIVVIGHGDKGYASVMGNAQLPEKSSELLSASFVSIYLDTDTQAGKTLAAEFGMSEGVVISGKSGKQQALRHNGTVSAEALSGYLTRFSQPAESVVTTELAGAQPIISTSGYTPVTVPTYAPYATQYAPQQYAPQHYAPMYSGGCASGNCGATYRR